MLLLRTTRSLRKLQPKLDDNRPLSPSELYRALNDALDEGHDLFDLSNRDARFALILMGGLNAASGDRRLAIQPS